MSIVPTCCICKEVVHERHTEEERVLDLLEAPNVDPMGSMAQALSEDVPHHLCPSCLSDLSYHIEEYHVGAFIGCFAPFVREGVRKSIETFAALWQGEIDRLTPEVILDILDINTDGMLWASRSLDRAEISALMQVVMRLCTPGLPRLVPAGPEHNGTDFYNNNLQSLKDYQLLLDCCAFLEALQSSGMESGEGMELLERLRQATTGA